MKRYLIAALILCACHRAVVPTNTLLWRVNGPWADHPRGDGTSVRTAQAVIISFRASHEYVEHHGTVIEQPDTSVYIVSGAKHVIAVGRWEQDGSDIKVKRQLVSPQNAGVLCDQAQLRFRISEASVIGDTGELTTGIYAPVTRLVSPDFESYINAAKRSPIICPEK
ncbi:MAG TPA: hypothetical protein VGK31_04195 [Thermoanaerobaculia bacterium]|jgi:hypothetical protein